jgi:hypothetical protein
MRLLHSRPSVVKQDQSKSMNQRQNQPSPFDLFSENIFKNHYQNKTEGISKAHLQPNPSPLSPPSPL